MTSPRENRPWLSKSLLATIRKKHLYIAKPSVRIKLTFGENINYVNGRPSVPSGLPSGLFKKKKILNPQNKKIQNHSGVILNLNVRVEMVSLL